MLAKELQEDTPGLKPYVWDSSVGNFVELQACATQPDPGDDVPMGGGGAETGCAAASSGVAPEDMEDAGVDDPNNPWLVRAAKGQKREARYSATARVRGPPLRPWRSSFTRPTL